MARAASAGTCVTSLCSNATSDEMTDASRSVALALSLCASSSIVPAASAATAGVPDFRSAI